MAASYCHRWSHNPAYFLRHRLSVVHIIFKALIQRIDRPGDPGIRKCFDQVQIPQYKVAFRSNTCTHACSPHKDLQNSHSLADWIWKYAFGFDFLND